MNNWWVWSVNAITTPIKLRLSCDSDMLIRECYSRSSCVQILLVSVCWWTHAVKQERAIDTIVLPLLWYGDYHSQLSLRVRPHSKGILPTAIAMRRAMNIITCAVLLLMFINHEYNYYCPLNSIWIIKDSDNSDNRGSTVLLIQRYWSYMYTCIRRPIQGTYKVIHGT